MLSIKLSVIFFLLSISSAVEILSKKDTSSRLLPQNNGQEIPTTHFGSTGFLTTMFLKKTLSEGDGSVDFKNYNELFFNIVFQDRKKELELLLVYMKTFQKDLSNKCKMAMLRYITNIRESGNQKYFLGRCKLISEVVFKRLHMSLLFFDLEYIYRSVQLLVEGETIVMRIDDEDEQTMKERNDLFFKILEKVIAASSKSNEEDFLPNRLNMIQNFYGPHFLNIFTAFLNDSFKIEPFKLRMSEETQNVFDWGFNVPQNEINREKKRVENEQLPSSELDLDRSGVTWKNLFRYYGANARVPLYDLKKYHML